MIDLKTEELIAVRDVPKLLPKRPNGKRVHVSAVYRWIQRGVRGVRLEAVRVGGTSYTSREALQRFSETLSGTDAAPAPSAHLLPRPTSADRQRQIERARRQVAEIVGSSRS